MRLRNVCDYLDSDSDGGSDSDSDSGSDSDGRPARFRVWRGHAQGGGGMRETPPAATARLAALLDNGWFMPAVAGQLPLEGHRSLSCVCRHVQFAMHQTAYGGIKVRRPAGQRGGG